MKKFSFIIVVLFLLSPAQGGPLTLQDLILKVENRYSQMEDLEASFTQKVYRKILDRTDISQGKLYYIKGGKFIWLSQTPQQLTVSNGEKLWFYDIDENQVLLQQLNPDDRHLLMVWLGGRHLREEFTIAADGKNLWHWWLTPKKKIAGIAKIALRISSKNFDIYQTDLHYESGDMTALTLTQLKWNQNLIERHKKRPLHKLVNEKLEFVPPKEAEITEGLKK